MQLRVDAGQSVQPGDVLAVVDVSVHSELGNTAALVAQMLDARRAALALEARGLVHQARQSEQTLQDRLRSLTVDITHAEGELDASQGRLLLAQRGLARDQMLATEGFLSGAQVHLREAELLDSASRERQSRRSLEALRREAQGVSAEIDAVRLRLATEQAQVARAHAGLMQEGTELASRRQLHLTAPVAAVVGTVAVLPGHALQAGQSVLSLLPSQPWSGGQVTTAVAGTTTDLTRAGLDSVPATPLQAQLYAPSRAGGFVAAGQPVWMRLHAFPYQKFGMLPGTDADVSRTPVQPQDLPAGMAHVLLTAAQAQEPLYRITVDLHRDRLIAFGQAQPLKAGMVLDADVVQERRAIWEWVLEPLLAARVRWLNTTRLPERLSAPVSAGA